MPLARARSSIASVKSTPSRERTPCSLSHARCGRSHTLNLPPFPPAPRPLSECAQAARSLSNPLSSSHHRCLHRGCNPPRQRRSGNDEYRIGMHPLFAFPFFSYFLLYEYILRRGSAKRTGCGIMTDHVLRKRRRLISTPITRTF